MIKIESKKILTFTRSIEIKHFGFLSPIDAYKTRYLYLGKSFLELDTSVFKETAQSSSYDIESFEIPEILNINYPILNIPYLTIEKAALDFLISKKPEKVPIAKLQNFVHSVFENYKFIPYHNFAHGFSVMQFLHSFILSIENSASLFDETHIFVSYIAALAHDLGHFGKNNAYNCVKKTKLAIKSKNKAVLEKFHIKKTLGLLRVVESNIFCNFPEDELFLAKELIIETILATDMAEHFNILEKFSKRKVDDFKQNDNFLIGYVVHAADLGNLCLDLPNAMTWGNLITQEFQTQTECEKRNQLKESEFMKFNGKIGFIKDQLYFASTLISNLRGPFVQIY